MNGRSQSEWLPVAAGRAGFEDGAAALLSALRHGGWWIDWHTRSRPGGSCRDLGHRELSTELGATSSSTR